MAELRKVRIRAAGCPDFDVELDAMATILDVKIAATAGCDIDPDVMRIICKGKILKDDAVLNSCGLRDGDALHVASGPPAAKTPIAESAANASPVLAVPSIRITLKGLGGLDADLDGLRADESVARIRELAAQRFNVTADEVHLLHKAKMLKDATSLRDAGIASGDVIRIARRQVAASPTPSTVASAPRSDGAVGSGAAGAPMPNVFGGRGLPPAAEEHARLAARALGVPLEDLLGGVPLDQAMAVANAAARQMPPEHPGGETHEAIQARLWREAQDMEMQVRAYLAQERARARQQALGPGAANPVPEDDDMGAEDAELMADIAGTLAEARSRGAPVPNPRVFVDRAVARRGQSRALQARLDREASGMEPELEDALAAAELASAAQARWPRRLGRGEDTGGGGRGDTGGF